MTKPFTEDAGKQKTRKRSLRNDNRISRQSNVHFQNFVVVAFPMENSVFERFPLCPTPPPSQELTFYFYCRLAVSLKKAHQLLFKVPKYCCGIFFVLHKYAKLDEVTEICGEQQRPTALADLGYSAYKKEGIGGSSRVLLPGDYWKCCIP